MCRHKENLPAVVLLKNLGLFATFAGAMFWGRLCWFCFSVTDAFNVWLPVSFQPGAVVFYVFFVYAIPSWEGDMNRLRTVDPIDCWHFPSKNHPDNSWELQFFGKISLVTRRKPCILVSQFLYVPLLWRLQAASACTFLICACTRPFCSCFFRGSWSTSSFGTSAIHGCFVADGSKKA